MTEQVDPLSEFTIALPTGAQSKLVSKAAHVAFGRGQTFEVRLIPLISESWSCANAIKQFVEREKASRAESWHADGAERSW